MHIVAKFLIGLPSIFVFIIYKLRRRHLSMFDAIERFLQSQNNLMPIRYSYSETNPVGRPSMRKVVEMLEGEVEHLQMPPDPCQTPQDALFEQAFSGESTESEALLCNSSSYINSLDVIID
ncbi:unnamed protein product [Ilex paraguariensis]|uniref:Uncharacterized protein n=1 Tax=Ilex paraguariensis TaxID=185542 RepID=A0ABC8TGL0_9AQUA